jgi:hypothetical protein
MQVGVSVLTQGPKHHGQVGAGLRSGTARV